MILLTATERNSNLAPLSEKVAIGHGNLKNHDVSASFCMALFLCLSFMVGISGSFRACWFRDPVYQPDMSASQSMVTFGGGNLKLLTELVMSQHSYDQKTLNNSVSEKHLIISKPKALDKISTEIFRTVGTCNYVDKNISNYAELRRVEVEMIITDAQRLIDACNGALSGIEINHTQTSKSRFNVLTHTRQLVAECIPFNQAMQYQDCIVKFAGWRA